MTPVVGQHSGSPHGPNGHAEHAWVALGGAVLAFIAGYVNVVMLTMLHVPVSHMSGAASTLAVDLAAGRREHLVTIAGILGAFFVGAAFIGTLIGNQQLRPGRRYGVALMLEGALLALATWLGTRGNSAAMPLAAMACGMQNAMATTYRHLIIRTTHITGILTDLGLMVGHRLRRHRALGWSFATLAGILIGFILGGVAGYVIEQHLHMTALAVPAGMCLVIGMGYYLWRRMHHLRAT